MLSEHRMALQIYRHSGLLVEYWHGGNDNWFLLWIRDPVTMSSFAVHTDVLIILTASTLLVIGGRGACCCCLPLGT